MPQLTELLASVPRLKVVAFLDGCREAEFGTITRLCDMNKSTLSKAMTVLEDAGMITVTKGYAGRRPRTWLALTNEGRTAYHDHLAALMELAQHARDACGEDSTSGHR
ncbi:transcriptional regulator [Nocardia cyriacigeorgica]|uniref:transcriptional regulator n=1 Tax=Nocardia cyriacigeorgica TaxID=135487 RepID=UPI00031AA13D|nr:transcriptional regulator [Nocardia cyriacigeorgica]MBF6096713.1 transcriptional regulator [Nocardia cyriacigeorgica]MBF6162665.1 transcriptional regulator [Nocardia cyriacigeorgica]MBF6198123.1 transcriptional regulator [Nocardia cyriacigeorgica]MBF6316987.1 transcriptional regulator [Nocardia cyriacigeorgica]MBF6347118.1 transcriptional regulator [Nocardia cyriacigeorgica]